MPVLAGGLCLSLGGVTPHAGHELWLLGLSWTSNPAVVRLAGQPQFSGDTKFFSLDRNWPGDTRPLEVGCVSP